MGGAVGEPEPSPGNESGIDKIRSRIDKITRNLTSFHALLLVIIGIIGSFTTLVALAGGPSPTLEPTFQPNPTLEPQPTFQPGPTFEATVAPQPTAPPPPTDPPVPTNPPPTQFIPSAIPAGLDDWADAADAACESAAPNLYAAFQSVPLDPATAWETAAGIVFSLAQYLRSIPAPASGAAEINQLTTRLEDSAEALSDGAFAVRAGNASAYGAATLRYQQAIADSRDAASAIGAHQCATLFS